MSSLDLDLDGQINNLELEWRLVYEASMVARADYQALAAAASSSVDALDMARERLERAEAKKARIMAKIERLEDNMLGGGR
jgi:uncharacterized protein (UPF0262 family)